MCIRDRQHRAHIYGGGTLAQKQNNAAGYLDLPAIAGLTTDVANGNLTLATPGVVAPVGAGLQQAQVNSNWVDFTVDSTFNDPDSASLNPLSPMNYIQAPCNSDSAATINATWVKAGAIRLRQTVQENQTGGLKEISISGYAPPGAVVP